MTQVRQNVGRFLMCACIALQAGSGANAQSVPHACDLLTRELAMKVSVAANKAVFDLPPERDTSGTAGSSCDYGGITLQIDPVGPATVDSRSKQKGREGVWVSVPGVGNRAYFRDNRSIFAELMGVVGSRTFFIQMGVPFQGTAEGVRPNLVALANAIIPRLR